MSLTDDQINSQLANFNTLNLEFLDLFLGNFKMGGNK